ncbi:MAG: hypothetical protein INR73_03010 [Williamsia sp.]|nr:hypothetical protein [Williamsia sp.]
MKIMKIVLTGSLCMLCLLLLSCRVAAQDSSKLSDRVLSMPDKLFTGVDKKAADVEAKLSRQTEHYLHRLDKQERRLKSKLMKKDSVLAAQVFGDVQERYKQLRAMSGKVSKYAEVYSGRLDSLRTGIKMLQMDKYMGVVNHAGLQSSLERLNGLQERFNQSDQIARYLQERQSQLRNQLEKLGMVKELRKYRKSVYYYQAQAKEYKAMFENADKLQKKVLSVVRQLPQFQGFFQRHSQLAGLFALPASGSDGGEVAAFAPGIQTNASMTQVLQEHFGSNSGVVSKALQQAGGSGGQGGNVLTTLKDKVSSYGSGSVGNSKEEVKDAAGFKPNNQKTRSFWKRVEVGTNVQSQKARSFFPVTTDLGASVGYKLNDRSVVGVGAAYRMGLGSGWNKIKVTHQGVGLRSYVDYKIKGSIYMTGGYEQNYRSTFRSISQLRAYSGWQSSGLLGLSKRYAVGKKLKGEMKLLWDLLSYQQTPKTQPILFRLGYNIK